MDSGYILATLTFAVAAIAFLLAGVIVREGPRQRLNWVTAGMLIFGGAGALLGAGDFLIALKEPKALKAQAGLLRSFAYTWEFFFPTFLLFALTFPRERQVLQRFPALVWAIFLPHAFHFALLVAGGATGGRFEFEALANRFPAMQPLAGIMTLAIYVVYQVNATLFPLVNLGAMLAASGLLLAAYRRAVNPRLRNQMRLILAGVGGCLGLYSLAVPVPVLTGLAIDPRLRASLIVAGLTLGGLSIAYAIVRHRFLDVPMLARRSILYGATTALLLGLYIALIRRIHPAVAGLVGIDPEIIEIAVLVVALLLFQPILSRTEEKLEDLLIGDRSDYRNVLRALARDVAVVLDLGELGRKVGHMLEASMMIGCGRLLVRPASGTPLAEAAGFGIPALSPALITAIEVRLAATSPADLVELDELLAGDAEVPPVPLIAVPLRHGEDLLGLLLLGAKVTGAGFNAEDRALLATLGHQIGVAIKNAHLHRESVAKTLLEEELKFARRVQQSFLPDRFPPMPPFDLGARNFPSKFVSGDYYDVMPVGENEILVAIGDVSGKGVPAALLMSMLRAALRTEARDLGSLSETMVALNRLIHESTSEREFATLFLARVDRSGLKLAYSNGGHNPPLLRRKDGRIERLDQGGLLLGAFGFAAFEEGEVGLEPEDILVLYTDGLTDAVDAGGAMFGDERLEEAVRNLDPGGTAGDALATLETACRRWTGGVELEDDLTLLVLRVDGGTRA